MKTPERPFVLMADDDDDDCLLGRRAFEESKAPGVFQCVEDGIELLDYLLNVSPLPALILIDLNMPRKDGRQALKEIRSIRRLQGIPLVVLSTSREERDVVFSGVMGAKSFITKPATFGGWVEMMKSLAETWLTADQPARISSKHISKE